MFVAGPRTGVVGDGDRAELRVRGAVSRTFGELTGQVLNPTLRGYVADMTAPYGLAVHEDLLDQGAGHSYGEMCAPLLTELVSEERPADLLVLATAVPDIRYGRATATYLSWQCPGTPLAFAVCDQGLLAAFTALHLIDGYARTGGCRRAVLLVAEQPTLYHELPVSTPVPDRAAAVGVVLEADGARGALSVRRHPRPAEHRVPEVLAAEVARLAADGPAPAVLLGAQLAAAVGDRSLGGDVRVCRENQPFTGIWHELSRGLPGWRESGGQVLLAEYDPTLGHLFSATLRFGG
jgi:4-hydroxymandelate oxidase